MAKILLRPKLPVSINKGSSLITAKSVFPYILEVAASCLTKTSFVLILEIGCFRYCHSYNCIVFDTGNMINP